MVRQCNKKASSQWPEAAHHSSLEGSLYSSGNPRSIDPAIRGLLGSNRSANYTICCLVSGVWCLESGAWCLTTLCRTFAWTRRGSCLRAAALICPSNSGTSGIVAPAHHSSVHQSTNPPFHQSTNLPFHQHLRVLEDSARPRPQRVQRGLPPHRRLRGMCHSTPRMTCHVSSNLPSAMCRVSI